MARGKRNPYKRKVNTREIRERFLIVCEGGQTEPNYFKGFRVPTDVYVKIIGVGESPIHVVNETLLLSRTSEEGYDQIWCVFDRDSWTAHEFNQALNLAERNGIRVAYSNEAFELWYVLHFQYLDTGQSRKRLVELISSNLDGGYKKNDHRMYQKLEPLMETAIENAKTLLATCNPPNPERDNPSTTVHLLVERLNITAV